MNNRDQQPPPYDDKGTEAEPIGCMVQDIQHNHSAQRVPLPHELMAEWTVNAQLKFARAGETVEKKFSANDTVNPVRVLYKWSTVDENTTASDPHCEYDTHLQDPMKITKQTGIQKEGSFRSTTSSLTCGDIGGADSAFSSSNNSNKQQSAELKNLESNFYGTRCRSTCNITVTAVADFLSPTDIQAMDNVRTENQESDPKSFVFNTTASCTVQPEKSSSLEGRKYLNFRDAVCQTSDTETKNFGRCARKRSPLERRDSRRSYDFKRPAAEDLLQKTGLRSRVNEDNSIVPSQMPSNNQTSKSSSTPRVSSLGEEGAGANVDGGCFTRFASPEKPTPSDSQRKPRTVHIDVYCTGSEDDDQADAELSTDSEKDDRILDQESNSTFQTVLENEQMRLRHQRKTGSCLPRRLVDNSVTLLANQVSDNTKNINVGHALTKSDTAEEIQESKQLLFRKHVGDQRAVNLQNLRQKYLRQSSDDTLSFGYPNSSRSTVRDTTCSSVSSLLAGQDISETARKECCESEDLSYSLTKSDSFEYENALDRLRIRQMERLWSRSHSNEDETKLLGSNKISHGSSILKSISELNSSQNISSNVSVINQDETLTSQLEDVSEADQSSYQSPSVPPIDNTADHKFQQTSHFPRNTPGFLQFFGPHLEHAQAIDENVFSQHLHSVSVMQSDSASLFPNYEHSLQRWKSEARDNLSGSSTPVLTNVDLIRKASPQPPILHQTSTSYNKNFQRSGSETPMTNTFNTATPTPARRFDMFNQPSPTISEASTQPPPFGYSLEYLDKAKMFGKVVNARKPGHHIGPTKNPNCSCESCQRWLAERFKIRGRIFSLGEMPVLKRPS